MKRVVWVDVLKGIGTLAVVIGHFYDNELVRIFLNKFQLPLFFFASGYLYKPEKIGNWIKRKFANIIKPYFFFATLSCVAWFIMVMYIGERFNLLEMIKGYLWGDYTSIIYNRVLWFMPAFFIIVTIYNVLVNLFGDRITYFISFLFACLWILEIKLPNLPWGIDEALMHYMPFVCIGNIYSKSGFYRSVKNNLNKWKILSVVLLVVYIITIFGEGYGHNRLLGYFAAVIGISMWAIISIAYEEKWKIMAKIGEASIVIMGLQGPIYDFWVKGYSMVLGITHTDCLAKELHAVICCSAVMFICYGIFVYINKKLPWILKPKQV